MTSHRPDLPPFPTPDPAPTERRPRDVDFVVTSILLPVHVLMTAFTAVWGLLSAWEVSDACSGRDSCDLDEIDQACRLTDGGGVAVLVVAVIAAVVLLRRRILAFWVPVVGIAAHVVLVAVSLHLLDQAAP